jgi:nucleoside 2-deoxyribosyltransferase
MEGWLRYELLKKGHVLSRKALMAMKFGDSELDQVVESCFRPAVSRAGFTLYTIIEDQPAGLIDDQLRVALRTSRFILADLTHGNNGAYWEAGFAEGLGRPVIYTCRETDWGLRSSHFDTNHLVTIIWETANLHRAGARLTTTIRATLPAEAKNAGAAAIARFDDRYQSEEDAAIRVYKAMVRARRRRNVSSGETR